MSISVRMRPPTLSEKFGGICLFSFFFLSGLYFRFHAQLSGNIKFYEDGQEVLMLKKYSVPTCENILRNITRGRWIKKTHLVKYKEKVETWVQREIDLERELGEFWVKRGIQTAFWRPDKKCGYNNYEKQPPNSTWPLVGSWCDAKGKTPCCTNIYDGFCMKPSKASCGCSSCVDLRKYIYADVSDWIVEDSRCKWTYYSAKEACDVIEDSPFSDIHFVGDSFSRNMFRTFVTLVTADAAYGALNKSTSPEIRERCTEMQQFFWKECRQTLHNMSETLQIHKLCGGYGKANFSATMQPYFNNRFKGNFLNLVKINIGKAGTLIIVSVGFHMGCVSAMEINNYLGPAVNAIEDYYGNAPGSIDPSKLSGRWPQIIISLPLSIGLLKPTSFLKMQNEYKCGKYSREMQVYAAKHDIRVLDFRSLTHMVHSFDGTHHGMNINLMKNQIVLNYIASLTPR